MSVTPEVIARIARLAALELDPDELPKLSAELSRIVDFVGQIGPDESSDGSAEQVTARLRPDTVTSDAIPLALFAPSLRDGFFVVPRLPAQEDG
ncbi:MAG: aspartyl/glutamyl-tRNA amidotransferase subunit C [Gemmatimonadales bacterium]